MIRKTRESLTESGLVTFERKILPPEHPVLASGGQRRLRQSYNYPNGSVIVIGGMDNPIKVMSTDYDLIYPQEAIEFRENEWEMLTTRLRNNRLPYQQIFGDTNPDAPSHWLKKRCDSGKCKMFFSCHEDNPMLYDRVKGKWTKEGIAYLAKLDALSGVRKERLRYGKWVQAEGAVFEEFNEAIHVITSADSPFGNIPPAHWDRYLSIDFGHTNPAAILFAARDPDNRLWVYREIYQTKTMVEFHAKRIKELMEQEANWLALQMGVPAERVAKMIYPRAIYCDHDAEDRATLSHYLEMATTPADKDVHPGIEAVNYFLRKREDGRPGLFIFRDGLDRRDPLLVESKLPASLIEEIPGYVWDTKKDKPVKENDHGADCLRYLCKALCPVSMITRTPEVINQEKKSMAPERKTDGPGQREKLRFSDKWSKGRSRLFGR